MSPAPSARLTRFLDADARRPAWVPLLGGFLGRFGAPYQAISADRTALGNALRDAARLLGSDIHVVLPDPTLLADALGAHVDWTSHDLVPIVADAPWSAQIPSAPPAAIASSGRLGAALGAYRDLRAMDPHIGLAIALTGPGLLAFQLRGEAFAAELGAQTPVAQDLLDLAGQAALQVVRAAGEVGTDLVVVLEAPSLVARAPDVVADAWQPIANLAAFYGAPVLAVPTSAHGDVGAAGGTVDRGAPAGDLADGALADLPTRWVLRRVGDPPTVAAAQSPGGSAAGPAAIGIAVPLLGTDDLADILTQTALAADLLSTTTPLAVDAPAAGLLAVKTWIESLGSMRLPRMAGRLR